MTSSGRRPVFIIDTARKSKEEMKSAALREHAAFTCLVISFMVARAR